MVQPAVGLMFMLQARASACDQLVVTNSCTCRPAEVPQLLLLPTAPGETGSGGRARSRVRLQMSDQQVCGQLQGCPPCRDIVHADFAMVTASLSQQGC